MAADPRARDTDGRAHALGDSNQRFATDPAVIRDMAAQGWIGEGAVMCVLAPA